MILSKPVTKNFTKIRNDIITNKNLSIHARFLFVYIASLPENWNLNLQAVSAALDMSLRSTQRALKELLDEGILKKTQIRHENGRFSPNSIYIFEFLEDEVIDEELEVSHFFHLAQREKAQAQQEQSTQEAQDEPRAKNPPAEFCRLNKTNNINKTNIYRLANANKVILFELWDKGFKQKQAKLPLPDTFTLEEQEAIRRFITYRKERGRVTKSTQDSILAKVKALKQAGHNVGECVEKSISCGWIGLFAPKSTPKRETQALPSYLKDALKQCESFDRQRSSYAL